MIGYPYFANEQRARETKEHRLIGILKTTPYFENLGTISMGLIPIELANEFNSNFVVETSKKIIGTR